MLIVTLRVTAVAGSRRTNVPWSAWCICARHSPLAQMAASLGITAGTAHACATAVIDLLAERAPGLLRALRGADPDRVLLDGTLTECERAGDGQADYSRASGTAGTA